MSQEVDPVSLCDLGQDKEPQNALKILAIGV